MNRNFKDPQKRRMYDHYRTAEIKNNTLASDRRMYWFGRFGYPASASKVDRDMYTYPAWAGGYDRFKAEGAPTNPVYNSLGVMAPYID